MPAVGWHTCSAGLSVFRYGLGNVTVKPDPLHLRLALDQLRTPPEQAVMVGDHVMDVLGGKAAGTRTLGILTPERPEDFFTPAAPDGVIRALPELRTWISP